jgi:hypothetical protein
MSEHISDRTRDALEKLKRYSENQGNEGAALTFSRLAESLFTESFFAGGATVNPTGNTLESEKCEAWMLSPNGGAPNEFAMSMSLDFDSARVSGLWTLPDGTAQTPSFRIRFIESQQDGQFLIFNSDRADDGATYGLCFAML